MDKKLSRFFIFIGISLVIVLIDQFTKWLVRINLALNSRVTLFPGFNIWHVHNSGAGFSILSGFTTYLAWISIIVVGIIIYYYPKIEKDKLVYWLCSIILGGTVGNLIDRLRLGFVTDFFDLYIKNYHYPTFNVADACISVSALILIFYLWKNDR